MLNIELYAKQINGLDIQSVLNPKKLQQPKPDVALEYYVYRGKKGYASFISSNTKERQRGCNIQLIFDGETNLLKDVKFIEVKHKNNQKHDR
jgi:hypothetical protein